MAFQKPSTPSGTRDFTPREMVRRNYIFDTIRKIFQTFGYQPIETPAMENLTTLMGKYGVEGDKLLFKILNSGNFLQGIPATNIEHRISNIEHRTSNIESEYPDYKELTPYIAEKGLRYDLTVPFARFVVQHQNELIFPFKRYQIQPVWRADRPQKGRYREFFQCDVDVIGSNSLLNEIELVQIIDEVFSQLGMNILIRINNRKILAGVAEVIGYPSKLTEITVAIDKLEKTGIEKVNEELLHKGISAEAIERLRPLFRLEGKIKKKIDFLSEFLNASEIGMAGIEELLVIKNHLKDLDLKNKFDFDFRLARGLTYYTGTIIEVKAIDIPIGSVCGGGRYDDLTGIFGLTGVSGVGISFGADRIYDVLNELKLFPDNLESTTKLLFLNFGEEEEKFCLQLLTHCRKSGIASEIYPQNIKLNKQLEYANRKNIPYVVFIGKDEMTTGELKVKDMKTGVQQNMVFEELKNFLLL
jgi:histidyl-tRNA synthetase